MSKKPNAIWHMVRWGLGSGTILAFLYIAFIVRMFGLKTRDILWVWVNSLVFGGGVGLILGLLDGLLLWALTRNAPIPLTPSDMQAIRFKVFCTIGIPTVLVGYLLTGALLVLFADYLILLLLPPIIAGIAATYAAHRYLFALRLWSERNYGGQKEKAKNVERLEDKPKNEVLDDGEEEATQHETS